MVLHERLRRMEWGVLALSAVGAGLIALSSRRGTSDSGPSLHGDLLVLASMFAAVVMVLCSKRLIASDGALW